MTLVYDPRQCDIVELLSSADAAMILPFILRILYDSNEIIAVKVIVPSLLPLLPWIYSGSKPPLVKMCDTRKTRKAGETVLSPLKSPEQKRLKNKLLTTYK